MSDYLPNFGRPEGGIGPVGLWKYVDKEGILDINLTVVRCRAQRTYHPTSRDQHWSLTWSLGRTGTGHVVQRQVHIVRESNRNHLTNWGPITVAIGNATIEHTVVINIGRVDLKARQAIEEIAQKTPVRKPNGAWNCQNWLEMRRARDVQPIPFFR